MIKQTLFTDAFGRFYFVKRLLIIVFGYLSYRRYNGFNKLNISGTEYLKDLPKNNVLFVSNHQTYFADVFAFYHVLISFKNGFINSIKNPIYLLNPYTNLYFVAAEETMKKGIFPKMLVNVGAVTVKRTWRSKGKAINRNVDMGDIDKIKIALKSGWLLTFPQGTTKAFAPGRKGTVHLIKENNPIVVPIVIDGFRRSFDKKGVLVKKKGVQQKMIFKKPMKFDFNVETNETVLAQIMDAIEQSPEHNKVRPLEEDLNRDFFD